MSYVISPARGSTVNADVLRDHCRCPKCYNAQTCQRLIDPLAYSASNTDLLVENIEHDSAKDSTTVRWKDLHRSVYPNSVLKKLAGQSSHPVFQQKSWGGTHKPNRLDYSELLSKKTASDSERLKNLSPVVRSLVEDGIVVITGLSPDPKLVESVVKQIGLIKDTFYGPFWVFTAEEKLQEADTAFTNLAIGPHTDGTYFTQTPGIQMFSTIKRAERGGQSIFVDGLRAYDHLNAEHRRILTRLRIPHEFRNSDEAPTKRYRCDDPVVVEKNGGFEKIRYNPYDRASHPASLSQQDTEAFYEAYRALGRSLNDESHQIRLTMEPGDAYFIDNWRVLHGRMAFEGNRTLCGCYMERDDFMSMARVLGFVE